MLYSIVYISVQYIKFFVHQDVRVFTMTKLGLASDPDFL